MFDELNEIISKQKVEASTFLYSNSCQYPLINYPDSGGGCCGGSSGGGGLTNTEALIFLAALAFAVAFLNQQITMFLGGEGRLKRKRREEIINHDPFNESKFPIYDHY